jgi:hypothetical protein
MFSSISRGSSRVRKSYICYSCLSSALGHLDSQSLRLPVERASRTTIAAFSTTPIKNEAEDKEDSGPKDGADGGNEEGGVKVSKVAGRKRGASRPISASKNTLAALRASLLAEEQAANAAKFRTRKSGRSKSRTEKSMAKQAVKDDKGAAAKKTDAPSEVKISSADSAKTATKDQKATPTKAKKRTKSGSTSNAVTNSKSPPSGHKSAKGTKKANKSTSKSISGGETASEKVGKVRKILSTKPMQDKSETGSGDEKPILVRRLQSGPDAEEALKLQLLQMEKDYSIHKARQWALMRKLKDPATAGVELRRKLVELIQEGRLSKVDSFPAVKLLRSSLLRKHLSSSDKPQHLTLKEALKGKSTGLPLRAARATGKAGVPRRVPSDSKGSKPKIFQTGALQAVRGLKHQEIKTISADELQLTPIDQGMLDVPSLSYGLERVLFNPGVYHLQDPRSRVFNFDPYLQSIMPVSEFDFNALKEYITSSRDKALLEIASAQKKKYTGSTSSMTSALAHFHFLLSQWRPVNTGTLSQNFPVEFDTFTGLQRGPSAIFLRWRDGTYAIDADKQYDSANILMMLGKSMEKLLTLPTEYFEKYRKENSDQITEEERNEAEAFHYTTIGDFLLRSQLDAHDPRLPGTGMFDLKTRAVVSVRMDADAYEEGSGYEIRSRHGEWESFDREYYDMIRAAFLKYSLQVRMGRMDGIFVAFHNTERIFGFQYISLPEMDYALHGTDDTTTGDSEFKLSLELLNRVLDRATAKFPEKSLRLHFETRKAETPFMYIFAEPVEEEQIEEIQATNKAEIEKFESRVLGLSKEDAAEEERKTEWETLQAKVEESMEKDELGHETTATDDDHEIWTEEEQRRVEELLNAAAQEEGEHEDDEDGEEDELVLDELEADEDVEEEEDSKDESLEESEKNGEDEESTNESLEEGEDIEEEEYSKNETLEEAEADDHGDLVDEDVEDNSIEELEDGVVEGDETGKLEGSESTDDGPKPELVENKYLQAEEIAETDENAEAASIASATESGTPAPEFFEEDDSILAMTLVIRNKVNDKYVERPKNLRSHDKWTVEYALAEVPQNYRAQSLYEAAKRRRQKVLTRAREKSDKDDWNTKWIENIRKLSRKGRAWRNLQNKVAAKEPVKTLEVRDGKNMSDKDRDVWEHEKQEKH